MKYGVKRDKLTIYMTEVQIDNRFVDKDTGYEEVYYLFSDALKSFISKADEFGCLFFFVSNAQQDAITIMATPDRLSFSDNKDIDGPYNDPLIAYGVGRSYRFDTDDYISQSKTQFNPWAHVVYDGYYDCEDHQYCKIDLPNKLSINVTPLNTVDGIKTGEHIVLRLLGYTDDICVFDTQEALIKEMHMPSKIIIPIGTYDSVEWDQDSSVVITGFVQNAYLVSSNDKLRYSVTVKTNMVEISLDVLTNYEIKKGDFIYAIINNLSAYF